MKNPALLIAVLALIAAPAVPSALADSSSVAVTPANGNDIVLPDGTVYQQNDDGSWSWIPDIATANAMGLDWTSLQPATQVPGPISTPFPSVVTLTNASPNRTGTTGGTTTGSSQVAALVRAIDDDLMLPDGQVYQENSDGSFSWIPDATTGNAMGLNWNDLQPVAALPGPVGLPFAHVG
jgi:hypothetical protein